MRILYSSRFVRRYKKLPASVRLSAERRESLFRKDLKNPILSIHKLKGKLSGLWAFSITDRYRIIFEFADDDTIIFHTVGDHDIYG
ncbi:MAG: type II toxin-antitoxin system mRNA interferase toxin, RelE/StbE family [Candidatus Paceibacterota bacterium]